MTKQVAYIRKNASLENRHCKSDTNALKFNMSVFYLFGNCLNNQLV